MQKSDQKVITVFNKTKRIFLQFFITS